MVDKTLSPPPVPRELGPGDREAPPAPPLPTVTVRGVVNGRPVPVLKPPAPPPPADLPAGNPSDPPPPPPATTKY